MAQLGGGGSVVYRSDPARGRCEKHLLSKTVSRAILRDNGSQERILRSSWKVLDREKAKSRMFIDRSMKAFRSRQLKKHGNWKREDEARLNCLNVPHIGSSPTAARPSGWQRLYTSPRYEAESLVDRATGAVTAAATASGYDSASGAVYVPLRPVVAVPRPGLELLLASCGGGGSDDGEDRRRIVLARLPSAVCVDERQLRRYDSYRGKRFLEPDLLARDQRVANLIASLGPNTSAADLSPFAAAAAAAAALPPIRSRPSRWRGTGIRPQERAASPPPPLLPQVASSAGSSKGSSASPYSSLVRRTLSSFLRIVAAANGSAAGSEATDAPSRVASTL